MNCPYCNHESKVTTYTTAIADQSGEYQECTGEAVFCENKSCENYGEMIAEADYDEPERDESAILVC